MYKFLKIILSLFMLPVWSLEQTYAIKADRLINGRDNESIAHPVIIVKDNRITGVNFNDQIPDHAKLIDLTGYTILPGLIDVQTLNAAEMLNKKTSIGQIAPGFLANIIAVKGNPLDDISMLQHVTFVMKEGKIYVSPQ